MPQRVKHNDPLIDAPLKSSSYSIGIGDGVIIDAEGGVQNVSAAGWTNEVVARRNQVGADIGTAVDGSPTNRIRNIRVLPNGQYEYPCTSTTTKVGTLFGHEKDAGGNFLDTDKLQAVTDLTQASFMSVEINASAVTTVKVIKLPPRQLHRETGEFGPWELSLASAHRSSSPQLMLSNWTPGKPVRLTTAMLMLLDGTLSSDVGVILLKNGSQFMQSLSFADGDGIGVTVSIDLALESSGVEVLGAADNFTFHTEGPVGAGTPRLALTVRYVYPS